MLLEADLKYCITGFLILSSGLVWPGEDRLPRPEKDPSMYSTFPSFQTVLSQCPSVDICFLLGVTTYRTTHVTLSETAFPKRTFDCFGVLCPSPVLCLSRPLAFQTGVPIFPGRARCFVACLTGTGWCFPEVAACLEQGYPHFPLGQRCPNLPFVLTFYASHLPAASGEFLCRALSLSNQSMVGCILKD